MRVKAAYLFFLLAGLAISMPASAQEGHPLTGTWYGDWGPGAQGNQITIVMSWDGEDVTAIMNPGPDTTPITVTLDSTNWTVHIEAVGKDASGSPIPYVADGTLDNVGSRNRTISGTWKAGTANYNFKITRD